MIRAGIYIIFILLLANTGVAQNEITKEQSIYSIDVYENGSALWSEEIYYPLPSLSAISEWNLSMKYSENNSRGTQIIESVNLSLLSAINYSGRPMSIRNFNISYELVEISPDAHGVIRFSFEWVNFSRIDGSNIIIGDAFADTIVPSVDNVLIIRIPQGFEAVNASPGFDRRDDKENRLIWDGTMYRSFKKGEPSLVISRKLILKDSLYSFPTAIAIIIFLVGGSLLYLFMRRYFSKKNDDLIPEVKPDQEQVAAKDVGEVIPDEKEIEPDEDKAVKSGANSDLPPITEDILGYEEMIERYLKKCGGQSYQSDIVNESGLSKSTISIVLSRMKDEGRILKIRKGKENVIRLAKKE